MKKRLVAACLTVALFGTCCAIGWALDKKGKMERKEEKPSPQLRKLLSEYERIKKKLPTLPPADQWPAYKPSKKGTVPYELCACDGFVPPMMVMTLSDMKGRILAQTSTLESGYCISVNINPANYPGPNPVTLLVETYSAEPCPLAAIDTSIVIDNGGITPIGVYDRPYQDPRTSFRTFDFIWPSKLRAGGDSQIMGQVVNQAGWLSKAVGIHCHWLDPMGH